VPAHSAAIAEGLERKDSHILPHLGAKLSATASIWDTFCDMGVSALGR